MTYNEKTKESIYKYRENNQEKFKEQQKKDFRKYYLAHRQQIVERVKARYQLKKALAILSTPMITMDSMN
jgi:hypothetical protein